MRRMHVLAAAAISGIAGLSAALAQDQVQPGPPPPQGPTGEPEEVTWSEGEFAEIAEALTGSWKTTGAVGEDDPSPIVMSVAPVEMATLPDALYVEIAREDSLDRPYSKSFLQLYRRQGELRMRTLEIRDPNSDLQNLVIGLWAAPELMPDIPIENLRGTLDLAITESGEGWVGESPYPYPTAVGGAVEMTSSMKIAPGRLETADRGYDAEGNVVWGASEGDQYVFEPTEPPFQVERREGGLIVITLRDDPKNEPYSPDDRVYFQYTGWLSDGTMFDTSRRPGARPQPWDPTNLIQGWQLATEGMSISDWRKFFVPSQLGYGASGAAGGRIPPDSNLLFEAELVLNEPARPRPTVPPPPRPDGE